MMADIILDSAEQQRILNGYIGTGLAVKRGYYPDHSMLSDVLSVVAESIALALDMHPREVLEIAARQADYSDEQWEARRGQLEEFATDAVERLREDLIGSALDAQDQDA